MDLPKLLEAPADKRRLAWESSYIGPSRITVRLALSRTLWPARWLAAHPPAPFTTCLAAGARGQGGDDDVQLVEEESAGASRRPGGAHTRTRSYSVNAAAQLPAPPAAAAAPPAGMTRSRSMTFHAGMGGAGSASGAAVSKSPPPAAAAGGIASPGSRKRRRSESCSGGDDPASLYASSVKIDLESMPLRGDSWLTSSLIDATLFEFATAYPGVHFLPCDFAAWDLPRGAKKGGNWDGFAPRDMLRRPVVVGRTVLPPVRALDWYVPLPTLAVVYRKEGAGAGAAEPLPTRAKMAALSDPLAYTRVLLAAGAGAAAPSRLDTGTMLARVDALMGGPHVPPPDADRDALMRVIIAANADMAKRQAEGAAAPAHRRSSRLPSVAAIEEATAPLPLPTLHVASPPGPAAEPPWTGRLTDKPPPGTAYVPPTFASPAKPIVFFWNERANHWLAIAVYTGLHKRIEVYEPMGKPERRNGSGGAAKGRGGDTSAAGEGGGSARSSGGSSIYTTAGLSFRSVPLPLILWLDAVCPLETEGGWRACSISAITAAHQVNGFDCGPAVLLYAEKIGRGLTRQTIAASTDQVQITGYRSQLMAYLKQLGGTGT
jgi:hypothetical protein